MLGGIQAGCSFMGQLSGSFRLNAGNLPFDSSSASSAPVLEHRVIFCMVIGQPMAAAMVPMAVTKVEHSPHLL
jgi:hypothetical protein